MSGSGEFRKSMFGGFKEEDVVEYIRQMNYDAKVTTDGLNQTILDLNAEKEDLQKESEALNRQISGLNKKISDYKQDISNNEAEIKSLNQTLNQTIEETRNIVSQKEIEISNRESLIKEKESEIAERDALIEKYEKALEDKEIIIESINAKLDKVMQENVHFESKLQMNEETYKRYNEINSHFGEILTQAHTKAERIVDDATAEMEEITSTSVSTINFFSDHFLNLKADIVKFEKMLTSSSNMLEERLVQLSIGMEETLDALEQKRKSFEERRISGEDTQITIDMSVLDEMEIEMEEPEETEL